MLVALMHILNRGWMPSVYAHPSLVYMVLIIAYSRVLFPACVLPVIMSVLGTTISSRPVIRTSGIGQLPLTD